MYIKAIFIYLFVDSLFCFIFILFFSCNLIKSPIKKTNCISNNIRHFWKPWSSKVLALPKQGLSAVFPLAPPLLRLVRI